jgi:hypothetical protein
MYQTFCNILHIMLHNYLLVYSGLHTIQFLLATESIPIFVRLENDQEYINIMNV